MLKHYLKNAWRSILRAKGYSAINILGLTIGMTVALLIGLWVQHEYSYDRSLTHYDQLYQVKLNFTYSGQVNTQDGVALPLVPMLRNKTPGVEDVTVGDGFGYHGLVAGSSKLYLHGGQVGEDFLKMFDFPLRVGNANTALMDLYSIVLTESTARALFGKDDPMGKYVRVDDRHAMKVTAVLKDLPDNSSFRFDYLMPFKFWAESNDMVKQASTQWNCSFDVYVQLEASATYDQIYPKIKNLVRDNSTYKNVEVFMHPLSKWRLYSDFRNGKVAGGFIEYVRMFSIIGLLVLIIACINFTNLSTARSEKRAREVGVRKVIGSNRAGLIMQFLVESLMITAIALVLSICLVVVVLPAFNSMTGDKIEFPYDRLAFWVLMIGYLVVITLLAGSRPAFYLSSFKPGRVLKSAFLPGRMATVPRKVLVALQFTCSIALIIGTIVVYQQVRHVEARPPGYDPNRLMMTDMSTNLSRNFQALREDLLSSGIVTAVTKASGPVTDYSASFEVFKWPGKRQDQSLEMAAIAVSPDYFETVGMRMVEGREFEGNTNADSMNLILNEAAVKRLGLSSPLNQLITWEYTAIPMRVIGVVRDAVITSPFSTPRPMFFLCNQNWEGSILYRLSGSVNTQEAIKKLTVIFDKYNPGSPYTYAFADAVYARKFSLQVLIGKLVGLLAILAVALSCLGLFSLSAYAAEQRTKEIGIRKVLGASVPSLWLLLSRDFLYLVGIGCVIASPIAWYFTSNWLNDYTYRITVGFGIFAWTYLLALVVTLVTISFQTVKAALANPISSIRTE